MTLHLYHAVGLLVVLVILALPWLLVYGGAQGEPFDEPWNIDGEREL